MENIIVILSIVAVIFSALSGILGALISNIYSTRKFKQELNYKYKLETYSKLTSMILNKNINGEVTETDEFLQLISTCGILGSEKINEQLAIVLEVINFYKAYNREDKKL